MKQPPRPGDHAPDLAAWLETVGPAEAFAGLAGLPPDAVVFAVDRDRNVLLWREGPGRPLGYAAGEVLGKHCLHVNRCEACMRGCGLEEIGAFRDQPLTLYRADGVPIEMRKTARAFFDEGGEFLGGIEVLVPAGGETARAEPPPDDAPITFHGMVSRDPAMGRVFQIVRNVAETDTTALVRGESGTGKELVARALHAESPRAGGPFVPVNCAALTESLMASELFGHVRGAFTGAVRDRKGLFEQADGGTLFLDEVAELSLDVQAKLLRVLEAREVVPVGGAEAIPVDVRVVAATHRSLRAAVADHRFRADLMYRLRVVPIFLPPLRDRWEDVEVLLWHFVGRHNEAGRRHIETVSPEAMRALIDYRWPGNVRELANVVAYAFAVGRGTALDLEDLPPELRAPATAEGSETPAGTPPRAATGSPPASSPAPPETDATRAARIRAALAAEGGHPGRAAKRLGISRATLWRWRRRLGL